MEFIANTLKSHKKKIIGIVLLGLLFYYLKKRITLQHLLYVADKVINMAEYLSKYLPMP